MEESGKREEKYVNDFSTQPSPPPRKKETATASRQDEKRDSREETKEEGRDNKVDRKDLAKLQKLPFSGCSTLDKYRIIKKIGEGTFGYQFSFSFSLQREVSKAVKIDTGDEFALKKILIHNDKEGWMLSCQGVPITALREIKILKSLDHPNVINLTEMVFEHGDRSTRGRGTIFMVFPFLDHDLTGILENPAINLSQSHIKSYFQQLLRGTAYLHAHLILHRDMKCSNILISNSGVLRLADLGLARLYTPEKDDRRYTNNVITRWYRPAELFLGMTAYDSAVDMWGVGYTIGYNIDERCVFGEMFKRKPMFPGQTDLLQLACIMSVCGKPSDEDVAFFSTLPDVKASLDSINHAPVRTLKTVFEKYDPLAVDLLDRLLRYDPHQRISASLALDHKYFKEKPFVAKPGTKDFKQYDSSHEYSSRQQKQRQEDFKHIQGGMGIVRECNSHYADDALICKWRGYDSLVDAENRKRMALLNNDRSAKPDKRLNDERYDERRMDPKRREDDRGRRDVGGYVDRYVPTNYRSGGGASREQRFGRDSSLDYRPSKRRRSRSRSVSRTRRKSPRRDGMHDRSPLQREPEQQRVNSRDIGNHSAAEIIRSRHNSCEGADLKDAMEVEEAAKTEVTMSEGKIDALECIIDNVKEATSDATVSEDGDLHE